MIPPDWREGVAVIRLGELVMILDLHQQGLVSIKTLAGFDFAFQPSLDRNRILARRSVTISHSDGARAAFVSGNTLGLRNLPPFEAQSRTPHGAACTNP